MGLSSDKKIYVMAIVKQEDVAVTNFDSGNLNDYKKQAKYISQQLNKWDLTNAVRSPSKKSFPSYNSDTSGTTINMRKLRKDMKLNAVFLGYLRDGDWQ